LRKLIRFAAVAFLVWAVTTFAWAALSHVTGATGPARASGATLDFVAGAITWADPPGVLGAPQRFAARQIRRAAEAVERLHRGPERLAAEIVDELGHRHRHGRHGGHFVIRTGSGSGPAWVNVPIDELDQARAHAEARAAIELERHRSQLDRARSEMERARTRMERDRNRARAEFERQLQERQRERIESSIERVRQTIEQVGANANGDLKRDMLRKLREILRDLEKDLSEVRVDVTTDLESADLDGLHELNLDELAIELDKLAPAVEAPVRVRIRNR